MAYRPLHSLDLLLLFIFLLLCITEYMYELEITTFLFYCKHIAESRFWAVKHHKKTINWHASKFGSMNDCGIKDYNHEFFLIWFLNGQSQSHENNLKPLCVCHNVQILVQLEGHSKSFMIWNLNNNAKICMHLIIDKQHTYLW